MSRYDFTLWGPRDLFNAMRVLKAAPHGSRITIKGPQRNRDQNAKMWAMLGEIALAKPGGRVLTTDQWKALFLHGIGREVKFLQSLDGSEVVPYGQSSSDLSVGEMSELIEFMLAWCAENGVELSDSQGAGREASDPAGAVARAA